MCSRAIHPRRRLGGLALLFMPLVVWAVVATAAQIVAAIQASPYASAWLRDNAQAVANLAIRVESGGETTAFNGSCCYGVLQMNSANIRRFAGVEPAVYRQMSLQEQINAWSRLTVEALRAAAPRQLAAMGTFDGRPVDGNLVLACVQLGIGNCQRMINSGRCSGFADRNGTTICAMADRMSNGSPPGGHPGSGSGSGSGAGPGSGGTGWTGGSYNPAPPCIRNASGACASITEALGSGFESGSGATMDRMKWNVHAITVGLVFLVMGSAAVGVWRLYVAGRIARVDFMIHMQRIGLVLMVFLVIMSVM